MFGDERPSCPDFAGLMQEWVSQYRGYVFLDYTYRNFTDPVMCISVDTVNVGRLGAIVNQRRILGYFDDAYRLHLVDKFKNPTGEVLVPEDPAFFPKIEAKIDELGGKSHG